LRFALSEERLKLAGVIVSTETLCCAPAGTDYRSTRLRERAKMPAA